MAKLPVFTTPKCKCKLSLGGYACFRLTFNESGIKKGFPTLNYIVHLKPAHSLIQHGEAPLQGNHWIFSLFEICKTTGLQKCH